MRVLLPALIILLTCTNALKAQTIRVLDNQSQQPLENVFIFDNAGYHTLTDANGYAAIDGLAKGLITFQYLGYESVLIPKDEIESELFMSQATLTVDEVVVSANKWEEDISEVPALIKKISREDIALHNPQTAADILSQSGEVFVQKSQLGGGSPMIRGFAASSVLISVDGVRMNNAIYRSGNLQNIIALDGLTTESAEVVFGPGSVIYGSDALGGVMDFHTIAPTYNKTSGEFFGRFSSANLEKTGHIKFNTGGKKVAFTGALTFSDFDDLITGNNRSSKDQDFGTRPEFVDVINGQDTIVQNQNINKQIFSGYSQFNALAKIGLKPTDNIDLSYAFHYTTSSNVPRYDRLTEYKDGQLKNAEWYYGPQKWQMHSILFKSFKETSVTSEAKLIATYQQVEESRHDRKLNDNNLRHRKENVDIYSFNADFFKELFKDSFYYGTELVYNKVSSEAYEENITSGLSSPAATRYPDGGSTWTSIAAYASIKHYFSTSLILNAGARYSHTLIHSTFSDTLFYNFPFSELNISAGAVNGSLGLVWKVSNEFNLKTALSNGFRAPNVDDMGKVFDSEPGQVVVPNEGLKPEYAYSAELTLSGKLNYALEYSVTGYYTQLIDAMVRRDFTFNGQDSIFYDGELSRVQAVVNAGKAYIAGISGNLKYTKGALAIATTLTYTTGRDLIDDLPLRHTPPLFGQTSMEYQWKNLKVIATQRYNGPKPFDELAPSEQNKPHIYSSDGSLSWTASSLNAQYKVNTFLLISGGIENIFDTHYRPYSSGISAPGRNFILSMKLSFGK